jgi:hypothetical protein
MKLYMLVEDALDNGMNLKRLLLATGLDERTFLQYHYDQMFTHQEQAAIKKEIKEWEGGQ